MLLPGVGPWARVTVYLVFQMFSPYQLGFPLGSGGFLLPPKNMTRWTGYFNAHGCVWVWPYDGPPIHPRQGVLLPPARYFWDKCYPMMHWHPIHPFQGVFLPCTQCSWDRICIYCEPNQYKAITEKQVSSHKLPWSNICISAILLWGPFLRHVGLACAVHWLPILGCQEEPEKEYFIQIL